MKKNFLLTMVVMLMTAVSSFAQKEYNMVITLSNHRQPGTGKQESGAAYKRGRDKINGNELRYFK